MVESVGSIVSKRVNCCMVVIISKSTRNQLKAILQIEVFGFLANDLLETFDTPNCHLNSDHHVEDHVPVIISNKDHLSFSFLDSFVNVLESFLLLSILEVSLFHFLLNIVVDSSRI